MRASGVASLRIMPISEAPANANEPKEPVEASQDTGSSEAENSALAATNGNSVVPAGRGSRWVDYETHELLQTISDLEDERRWSRLREGIWLAILIHLLLLSAITLLPEYVFKQPPLINPFNISKQPNTVYLNQPVLHAPPKEAKPKPMPPIDRKTLEALNHTPKSPVMKAPTPPPAPVKKAPAAKPKPTQPVAPSPKAQAPAPPAHPAPATPKPKPNFAMNMGDPAQQLQQAMRNAARSRGSSHYTPPPGGLAMHPGANTGGVQILTNTQGVDFSYWLRAWYMDTEQTWDPLIPDEVNPPISKSGQVLIRFKVLRNGQVMPGSMVLEGSSGDTALDRAAWGAITGSSYPPLPKAFHGPYIELRALFLYNMRPHQ